MIFHMSHFFFCKLAHNNQSKYNMGTKNVCPSLSSEGYESPVIQVVSVRPEGVLCQSGQFEEWEEETLQW